MRHWHWWICTLHCWTDSTSSTNDKCRWCDVFPFGIQLIHFVTHILSHLKSYSCFISKKVELVTYAKKSQPETLRTERRMPNLRCLKQRCVVLMWHGDCELWLIFVFGLLTGHPQFHSSTKRMDSGGSTLGAPMHISCYLTCSFLCFFLRSAMWPVAFEVQYVSSTPATRLDHSWDWSTAFKHWVYFQHKVAGWNWGADVVNLQEDLDKWLQQRQASSISLVSDCM